MPLVVIVKIEFVRTFQLEVQTNCVHLIQADAFLMELAVEQQEPVIPILHMELLQMKKELFVILDKLQTQANVLMSQELLTAQRHKLHAHHIRQAHS